MWRRRETLHPPSGEQLVNKMIKWAGLLQRDELLGTAAPLRQLPTLLGAWANNWDVCGIARTVQSWGWMHFPAGPEQPAPVGCLDVAPSRWQKRLCVSVFTAGDEFLEGMMNWGIWTQTKFNRMSRLLVET